MKLSILDFILIPPSENKEHAIQNSISLARLADDLGYHRIWYAEHHRNIAFFGCAPEIFIPLIASKTKNIRVGSGGILLNHYSTYKIAELFALMTHMFPDRIDMGIGMGTSSHLLNQILQETTQPRTNNNYERVKELLAWTTNSFPPDHPCSKVEIQAKNNQIDLWMLGSTTKSAIFAGENNLPYSYAGFINPTGAIEAISAYHKANSEQEKSLILALNIVCAKTDAEVRRLISPMHMMFKYQEQGVIKVLPTPNDAIKILGHIPTLERTTSLIPLYIAGTPIYVRDKIQHICSVLNVNEIMINDLISEHKSRLNSYKLLAKVFC